MDCFQTPAIPARRPSPELPDSISVGSCIAGLAATSGPILQGSGLNSAPAAATAAAVAADKTNAVKTGQDGQRGKFSKHHPGTKMTPLSLRINSDGVRSQIYNLLYVKQHQMLTSHI